MTLRTLKSTSAYVDGYEHERELTLEIPDGADDETLEELLHPESGAGHFGPGGKSIDAYYEIVSTDGLEPEICWDAGG